ncbi:MAG TPA: LAGLIDADG family homing endonuclease, partial [Chloroflexota bacterium]|nr:LAGLIDADG family homing endonuclease [Chloroflexota bacterium]
MLALAVAPSRRASQRFCALYATGSDSVLELDDPDRIAALAEGTPVVTASPRSAQRLVESAVVWDVLELASLLAPECPAGSLDRAASFCGLSRQTTGLQGEARLTLGVFQVLLAILDQTDTQTLLHATRLARPLDWPLRLLFSELERARAKSTLETGALAEAAPLGGWIAQGAPARRRPSHEPPPAPTLLDVAEVAERLSPSGPIAHALPAYEPREQQVQMARLVAETLNTGGQTLLEAGTGVGKALDVDTPMPTPSGWTRMGDLRIGDAIFDEQGKPTHVTAAFDIRYDRPCYEIEFSDGSTLVADAEHEWLTYTSRDRKWAGRPRGETYKSKNFVQQTTLDALRTTLERLPRHAELSRTDAQRLVGGHGWSVRQAALATRPTTDGVVAPYAARELLPNVLRRLERDFVEQRRDGHAYSLLTTEQIAESLRVTAAGRSNHAIPVAGPLALPEAKLPVDPYFLGAWLGDGNSRSSQITTADPEVLCEIALAGYATRKLSNRYLHAVDDENRKARSRWQRGLTGRLRALGVIQNKHIPNAYLRASERQRTALLAGLLDTDGTVSVNGAVQFTTTHPRLSEGLHELACSLGFRPTVMQGHARLHGRDCGPKSTIHFTTDQQVYRLPRKVAAHRERLRNYSRPRNRFRYIVSVRPVPTRPVRCIQVDAPSHLYLAGTSFIPTHNSLAYLLPAALKAVRNRSRVVVSTATITLQDQLFEKDLPVVQAVLGSDGQPLRATVLKGRANYLCLRRWQTLLHATDLLPEERSLLIKTLFWLPRTRTGDRAELRLTPAEEQAWQRLSALAEACTPQRCPYHRIGVCFLARARRAAEESHIVIANHALLLSDLVTRSRVLPEYQVLVVDEAHHLEDEATQQLGWRLTERELLNRLERLWSPGVGHHGTGAVAEALALIAAADGLRVPSDLLGELEHGERAVTDLGAGIRRFFEGLAELLGDADVQGGGDETTLRLSHAVRAGSRWQELEAVWADASQQLEVVERVVGSLEDRLHGLADSPEGAAKALAAELGSQLDTWRDVRRRLGAAVHAPDTGTVYWLASSPRQRSAWLSAAPLDVAALLRDKLFAA